MMWSRLGSSFQRALFFGCLSIIGALLVLCAGPVGAATYTLPDGNLPAGCSRAGGTVTCGNLNLAWNDVVIVNGDHLILNVTGNASMQNAQINMGGSAAHITINISGSLTTGSGFRSVAIINVGGSATLASSNHLTGNLTASSIQTGSNTTIAGNLIGGTVSTGSANTVNGNVSGSVVTINSTNSTINGSIQASSNVHVSSGSTVNGDISGANITTTSAVTLNGNINASGDFTLASGSSLTGNVRANSITLLSSNATVSGDITADDLITLGWNGTVNGDATAPLIVSNGGHVNGDTYCDASGGSTPVVCSSIKSGLILEKIAGTSAAVVGDTITFTITATNLADESLVGLVVEDVLPNGMIYITHVATLGSVHVSGQTLAWSLPVLAAEGSATLTIAISLSQQGTYTNTATAPGADPASASVLVLASAVTHFRLDEPVGSMSGAAGEVIDSGGTGLHGRRLVSSSPTATNFVTPVPTIASQYRSVVGDFCNAASFDGGAIIEVADSPLFDYTTQLSASAWIFPTAYPTGSNLFSILSNDVNYEFHINSSGRLFWWWQASTLTSATTIPLNQWTHVAITFDSRSGVRRQRIYINGVLDTNTNNWQGTLSPNQCNFYIGGDVLTDGRCTIDSGRNFRGMIDEVKLYSFELNEAEVRADMQLGRSCSGTFDHIRIEHNGSGSICSPERVTLKACMNSECTVLYPGNVTVNLAESGWVDGNTFTFSGVGSRQISRAIPGEITLGTTSVSPVPAGTTRCYSGATQTCRLNFEEASCAFDAVESGGAPQSPIHTKLSGTPFGIDVLALLTPTSLNPDFGRTVLVDLVDATGVACPSGSGLTATTNLEFTIDDAGRKSVTFNYPGAAANVRVRIRDGASAPACSNDNFAIRPQTLVVTSEATNTTTSGVPTFTAGGTFELTAQAVSGYDGTPLIDGSRIVGSPHAGSLTGAFTTVSEAAVSGDFSYSEVGHFGLNEHAIYDQTFTMVDQPDGCHPNYSNTLVDGKYGCFFGSGAVPFVVGSSGFGRFIPDHLDVTTNTPTFGTACGAFTYAGQPFHYTAAPVMTVTARNAAGGVTQNYAGDYWRIANSSLSGKSYSVLGGNLDAGLVPSPDPVISDSGGGTGTLTFSSGGGLAVLRTTPTAPFDAEIRLQINVADTDGVTFSGNPAHFGQTTAGQGIAFSNSNEIRYGRLVLDNAFGPETLPLTVPVRTEYFDDVTFIPNDQDQCSAIEAANTLLTDYSGNLAEGDTQVAGAGVLINGFSNVISLSAPGEGNDGSVFLEYDLNAADLSWLGFDWEGDGSRLNPAAKATFGIFKGNPRMIYMRESVW